MGIKFLAPSEKINNSQNLYPTSKNNISFQSLNNKNKVTPSGATTIDCFIALLQVVFRLLNYIVLFYICLYLICFRLRKKSGVVFHFKKKIEVVLNISSSWVKIRLHTENQPPRIQIAWNCSNCNDPRCGVVVVVWWCGFLTNYNTKLGDFVLG